MVQNNVHMPFDSDLEIIVTCDSLNCDVGSVIAHILPVGTERPVTFASQTLKSKKNYRQVEKEALGLIFRVQKCHNFFMADVSSC